MRFCRFTLADGVERCGIVEGPAVVELEGNFLGGYGATDRIHSLGQITFLPPVVPSKIVALGTNFRDHASEMAKSVPDEPRIFLKPPSSLLGHQGTILLPDVPGRIEHEAEVALVLGRTCRHVSAAEAVEHVFGYTCFNDVTARALQKKDGVYARAKGFDTFAPAGPWIDTDVFWEDLVVEGWVNGERRQRGALKDLVFKVPEVIAFVSRIMTLLPGDLIVLGTPAGVDKLRPGDVVQVKIESIGTLENPVEAEQNSKEAAA